MSDSRDHVFPVTENSVLNILFNEGAYAWSKWRNEHRNEPLSFDRIDLRNRDLRGADFAAAQFHRADLSGANLSGAYLGGANFYRAKLNKAILTRCNMHHAVLHLAELRGANLSGADLTAADLGSCNLTGAEMDSANLEYASMVESTLSDVRLSNSRVYGISAWGIKGTPAEAKNLRITPQSESAVQVDDLEVAQLIYLLLNREKLRSLIDATTQKGVLILGRFSDGGLDLLQNIADGLRTIGYLPMLFDFDRPAAKTYTDTIRTLIGLARFVVVDLSGPSVPQELTATIPFYKIPFVPILEQGKKSWSMFVDFLENEWVLPPVEFSSREHLISILNSGIVVPAEQRVAARQARLDELFCRGI